MTRLLLLFLVALTLGACSSFDRDWRAAQTNGMRGRDRFSGSWDGQWGSEKHRLPNGQLAGGRLRCIFTKQDASHYHASFYANWLVFASGYDTTFTTKLRAGGLDLSGAQDLGAIFGGVYHYDGRVLPDHFRVEFKSNFDHGVFDLRRPAAVVSAGRLTR